MKAQEVELIIFKVVANGEEAINMKIYKNGTTCRVGAGGLPPLGISGMSFFNDSKIFDALFSKVPEQILEQPQNYEEETPNGYLEYILAFYGVSKNGDTGERAEWTKSTGARVKVDQRTTFNHPIIGLLDALTMEALELTNEWYFDVIINARYKVLSSTLPKQTIIAQPKTEEEIHNSYANYINQMMTSPRNWSMENFSKDKLYEREGKLYKGIIQQDHESFSINFIPVDGETTTQLSDKKPWWKVW